MSRYNGSYSPPRGPERWDRERFERARGPQLVERERYEEIDRYERDPPPRRRDRSADEFYLPRPPAPPAPPTRYMEKDRYVEETFTRDLPSRSRAGLGRYYDEMGDDVEGAEMVPYERRRESYQERFSPPRAPRTPGRPVFLRRQSSLDTFDRKPMPRYSDQLRSPPEVIPVPMPRRRRSPPRFVERDIEEIRVAEPDYYGDEEFRGYREREVTTFRKRGGEEIIEEKEEEVIERPFPRKGKTRMPMRLVNRRAVIELGYPFEEDEGVLVIQYALGKDQIDEVIKLSKEMNAAAPAQETIIERRTEIIREGPEVPRSVRDWETHSRRSEQRSPSPSSKSSVSSKSRARSASSASSASTTTVREIILDGGHEESAPLDISPIGALIIPERRPRRNEQTIRAEIRALEAEQRRLKGERETRRIRADSSDKVEIIRGDTVDIVRGETVRVEKDRKGRLSLVR